MGKKIILVGKAASGKDYFKNYLLSKGFKTSVSHTTRPMRDEEVNGETYHFVSKYTFLTMGSSGKFFEFKKSRKLIPHMQHNPIWSNTCKQKRIIQSLT